MGLISARSSYEKVVFSRLSSQRANSSSGMDPDLYKIAAVLHHALRRRASATLCNEFFGILSPQQKDREIMPSPHTFSIRIILGILNIAF
jgi:hypothetical protein